MNSYQLQFQVSLNEEHIFLQARLPSGEQIDLGERAHHYCLVTLARRRLQDARRGIDATGQGWVGVEELARMLGLETPHLNIQLFRARQHVACALAPQLDARLLLERRRGEVRLGGLPFRIVRGAVLEGECEAADVMPCNPS